MSLMKTVDRLIEETGITVAELAEKAKLEPARTQAIIDGRWTPSPREREKIAAAFGVSVTEISWGHRERRGPQRTQRGQTPVFLPAPSRHTIKKTLPLDGLA